jgi:hypothetical protein
MLIEIGLCGLPQSQSPADEVLKEFDEKKYE